MISKRSSSHYMVARSLHVAVCGGGKVLCNRRVEKSNGICPRFLVALQLGNRLDTEYAGSWPVPHACSFVLFWQNAIKSVPRMQTPVAAKFAVTGENRKNSNHFVRDECLHHSHWHFMVNV